MTRSEAAKVGANARWDQNRAKFLAAVQAEKDELRDSTPPIPLVLRAACGRT
jgi:hypothetical protein